MLEILTKRIYICVKYPDRIIHDRKRTGKMAEN
jgi:hypothetical protein